EPNPGQYRDHCNFSRGDVHRLITISTTHYGSDICRLMTAYKEFAKAVPTSDSIWTLLFLGVAHKQSGVFTGGFRDQVPGSKALKAIGYTPVASHAIACV